MAGIVQVADLGVTARLKVCFLDLHRSGPASKPSSGWRLVVGRWLHKTGRSAVIITFDRWRTPAAFIQ